MHSIIFTAGIVPWGLYLYFSILQTLENCEEWLIRPFHLCATENWRKLREMRKMCLSSSAATKTSGVIQSWGDATRCWFCDLSHFSSCTCSYSYSNFYQIGLLIETCSNSCGEMLFCYENVCSIRGVGSFLLTVICLMGTTRSAVQSSADRFKPYATASLSCTL